MIIVEKCESRERCAEAGWYAYDYILTEPIDKAFILGLKGLGAFVYLPMLKKPFFKVESDHYLIKGVQGDAFFRIAVHGSHCDELHRIEAFVSDMET